jgi:hypothetical protein
MTYGGIYTYIDCQYRIDEIITTREFEPLHFTTTDPLLLDWSECKYKGKSNGCCVNRIQDLECPCGFGNTFDEEG